MYPSSGSTLRADINAAVIEANAADSFFIGDRVLPPFGMDAMSGTYPKVQIAAGGLLEAESTNRARGSNYGRVTRAWTTDTYDCQDRGLEEALDDVDRADLGRFFDAGAAKAKWLLRNIKLAQEVRVAAAINNASTFAATNSNVAYTEATIATINVPLDILDAIGRVNDNGNQANTIVMSSTVMNRIRRSTLLQNFVRGALPSDAMLKVNPSTLAAAFKDEGIEQVLVGRARYNSAKKGQSYTAASVWGTTYVWVGHVKAGNPFEGGAGRILVWNDEGGLYVTETYREEAARSDIIRVRQNTIEKIIDATSGTLITTQWA